MPVLIAYRTCYVVLLASGRLGARLAADFRVLADTASGSGRSRCSSSYRFFSAGCSSARSRSRRTPGVVRSPRGFSPEQLYALSAFAFSVSYSVA